jgi:hypothetical protein
MRLEHTPFREHKQGMTTNFQRFQPEPFENGTRAIRNRVSLTMSDVQFDTGADRGAEYDRLSSDWWVERNEGRMLEWMKKRRSTVHNEATAPADAVKPHGSNKAGKYQFLYEYLENRYADTVVLTFEQIEDLLGFRLPDLARNDQNWWAIAGMSTAEARYSDAWTLASRTARPNLMAQTVVFERVQ